jgi:Pal1 cell morphology protein
MIIFSFSPAPVVSISPRPSGRRSQSDDSFNIVEKPRYSGKPRSKKSSQHADVIDRLDFTGVGPSMSSTLLNFNITYQNLVFHHDGPFDACAPSRNKHHNKAPIYAWGTISDEPSALRYGDAAYPSVDAYKAFSNDYPEPPKKKVDAIAEAWGIHEPEPFEEFFAGGGSGRPDGDTPASSIYNGKDTHNSQSAPRNNPTVRRVKDSRDSRDASIHRSGMPPPQPIFVPDPSDIELPESPPASSTGFPKRSKSLMHRIRKMRDSPNVPVGPDYDQPPSPSSPTEANSIPNGTRPTHRSQNSFLGRFGGASRANQPPVPEKSEKPEPYVFIEPQTNKELPVLPTSTSAPGENIPFEGYPESQMGATHSSPERLGRKPSLMRKVGRVVRGAK